MEILKMSKMFTKRILVQNLQQAFRANVKLYCQNSSTKNKPLRPGKRYASPMITLYQPVGNKINVITLDEAIRLSKRRGLRLIKLTDSVKISNERDEYRLMTEEEFMKLDNADAEVVVDTDKVVIDEEKPKMKDEKFLNLNTRMGEHDILTKIKSIEKWLQKRYQARIVISTTDSNLNSCEKIFDTIVKTIGTNGKIVQKRSKNSDLKFQILPTICLKK